MRSLMEPVVADLLGAPLRMLNARDQRLKDALLRALPDDSGADTLRRYFAQLQYTAAYCIRMLRSDTDIEAIVPEVGDDVVVVRVGSEELRQVKTRAESVGAWRFPDVLDILCKQYALRVHFRGGCTFHFVSDQGADPRSRPAKLGCGPLFRLKDVLARSAEGSLEASEQDEMKAFEAALCPEIVRRMRDTHSETLTDEDARGLLHRTRIETEEPRLREFNWPGDLHRALKDARPGTEYRFRELEAIWQSLILLVVGRIVNGSTAADRRIVRDDVVACLSASAALVGTWGAAGVTRLERKCLAGGFDAVRVQNFARQRLLSEVTVRQLESLGLSGDLEQLAADLSERQAARLSESVGVALPGPHVLALVKSEVSPAVDQWLGTRVAGPRQQAFGEGVLWRETEACYVRWDVPSVTA